MTEQPYPSPLVTVDTVIFTLRGDALRVLLVRRADPPFEGSWALPGGYIHVDEDGDLEAAARRILRNKAGLEPPYLEQLQAFGGAGRDPRGWAATFAYFALIGSEAVELRHGANADAAAWVAVEGDGVALPLAFDHAAILAAALRRLRAKVEYSSLPVHLLPGQFTLTELQQVYEAVLGRRIDKSAFRKRIAREDFIEPIEGEWRRGSNRPAQLFRIRPGAGTAFFDSAI